jgi:hypothetical protein
MTTFLAILLPLAVVIGFVGVLVGAKIGQVLIIAAAILAGMDLVLVLAGR